MQQKGGDAAGGDAGMDAGIIPGFEQFKPERAAGSNQPSLTSSPAISVSGVPERLRSTLGHGGMDPADGTPGAARPRHHRFKVVSKSSTPIIHGSPALPSNMPSDESTPNSPARRSGMIATADIVLPDVMLPEKPDGEVEKAVAERVERYMTLRGKREPVYVNKDLYDKKEFHNPGILEMLMSQYKIVERGSNYPKVKYTCSQTLAFSRAARHASCTSSLLTLGPAFPMAGTLQPRILRGNSLLRQASQPSSRTARSRRHADGQRWKAFSSPACCCARRSRTDAPDRCSCRCGCRCCCIDIGQTVGRWLRAAEEEQVGHGGKAAKSCVVFSWSVVAEHPHPDGACVHDRS